MPDNEEKRPFFKSFVAGELSFGFWNILSKTLSLAGSLFILANLSLYEFGVYQLVLAFYGFIGGLLMKILNDVIVNDFIRFRASGEESKARKLIYEFFFIKMTLASVLTICLFFGARVFSGIYDAQVADFFRIVSFLFIADGLYTLIKMILESERRHNLLASRHVVYDSLRLLISVFFVYFYSFGIREILYVHLFSSVLATAVYVPAVSRILRTWPRVALEKTSVIWSIIKTHGKWTMFSPFVTAIPDNLQPWLIKIFIGTEAVSVFNVALMMADGVKSLVPVNTLSYLVPRVIDDKEQSQRIFTYSVKYLFFFGACVAVLSYVCGYILITFFLPKYSASLIIFAILLIGLPIRSAGIAVGAFIVALRKQKYLFYQTMAKTAFSMIAIVVLLYAFGNVGLAIESVLTLILVFLLHYFYLKRKKKGLRFEWSLLFEFNEKDRLFFRQAYNLFLKRAQV